MNIQNSSPRRVIFTIETTTYKVLEIDDIDNGITRKLMDGNTFMFTQNDIDALEDMQRNPKLGVLYLKYSFKNGNNSHIIRALAKGVIKKDYEVRVCYV